MQKIIFVFAVVAAALILPGCEKNEPEKQKNESALSHFKATPAPDQKNYKQPKF